VNRVRIGAGLLMAVIGTLWWAGAVPAAGVTVVAAAPYLLLLWAVVAAVGAMAPRRYLAGPVVLAAAGGIWLLLRAEVLNVDAAVRHIALLVVLAGVVVALTGHNRKPVHFGVRRFRSFLYGREFRVTGRAPSKISVLSVLFPATLDLLHTAHDSGEQIVVEIDVTVLAGQVEVVLPPTWSVAAGRILSSGVRYNDELIQKAPVTDAEVLEVSAPTAVINVTGLGGRVLLTFRPQAAPR